MSKPRYRWWGYIKAVIRAYPALCEKLNDLQGMSVTSSPSGMPRGGNTRRGTEESAMRELPQIEQKEYEAVKKAVETTERYANGGERLEVIRLVFWKRTHTIEGAANRIPVSWRTAAQWHGDFIRQVARNYGLMEEQNGRQH